MVYYVRRERTREAMKMFLLLHHWLRHQKSLFPTLTARDALRLYTPHSQQFCVKFILKPATKAEGAVDVYLYLGARWGGWLTLPPGRFTLGMRPGTHCTGAWVGPRAGVDRCGEVAPTGNRSPDFIARSKTQEILRRIRQTYLSPDVSSNMHIDGVRAIHKYKFIS